MSLAMNHITKFRTLIVSISIILLCSACHHHDKVKYSTSSEHTLLVYMIGDDRILNSYVEPNLAQMRRALQESETPLNLVIYRDNWTSKNNLPQLYQLKRRANSNRTDTIFIKKWDKDVDSTDPAIMKEVVKLTFSKFDTPIKGIEIWSHGLSWIPSNEFQGDTGTRAISYIGNDDNHKSDLWNVSKALQQSGVHFDYMLFDACHMATAEVAYEFQNVTDYILASPIEITAEGFPYRSMYQSLSSIQSKEQLETGLTAAFLDYKNVYKDNGAFSLLRTDGFETLLAACRDLEAQCSSTLEEWQANPSSHQSAIQQYGRVKEFLYLFYDVEDWSRQLCQESNNESQDAVLQALRNCVVETYHSPSFVANGGTLYINRSCGLAMSIPQFWSLSSQKKLDEAYSLIQWNL